MPEVYTDASKMNNKAVSGILINGPDIKLSFWLPDTTMFPSRYHDCFVSGAMVVEWQISLENFWIPQRTWFQRPSFSMNGRKLITIQR